MSEQVRLSDKQAMACANYEIFDPIGGDWSAFGGCCGKKKKN
jgi:hypothetical protein